jgi:hypothetical protein
LDNACWVLDFPVLDGLGRDHGDKPGDALIVPDGWGRLLPRPSEATYDARYPDGDATMEVLGYSRQEGTTLALLARDGRCFSKEFFAEHGDDKRCFSLKIQHLPENMGETRHCEWPYQVEMTAFPGDWYALARHYRLWATNQVWCDQGRGRYRSDSPEWFRKLVWWFRPTGNGSKIINDFTRVRGIIPESVGFHWYEWSSNNFDTLYPEYFPARDYVPATLARLHESGVKVMPYINGRLWDTNTLSYKAEGASRWATKSVDGSVMFEPWLKNMAHMCPYCEAWQKKMLSVTDRLFREFGVDGVYVDEVGSVPWEPCFDKSHGHPLGGGNYYVNGNWSLLKAIRENGRRIQPDAVFTTEDTAEPYIGCLDGMLMCDRTTPDSIPFFPAVYHDFVAQFGLYVFEPDVKAGLPYRSKEAMLFQFGGQLGWEGTTWKETRADLAKWKWLAKLASYRQLGLDWLAYGEMLHPPAVQLQSGQPVPLIPERWMRFETVSVDTKQPAITTSAWRAPDGRVALFAINVSDESLAVRIVLPPKAQGPQWKELTPAGIESNPFLVAGSVLESEFQPQTVRMFCTEP